MSNGLASNGSVAPLVGLALFVLATASAWGHAVVVESDPPDEAVLSEAPSRVTLRFNARIEKTLARVTLTTGQGENQPLQVLTGAGQAGGGPDRLVIPLPALGPGRYGLRYRVLATDGHVTEGVLRFTVGGAP